jgi:DNA helicase-2/ATP-dependent DNA helicase PcrA
VEGRIDYGRELNPQQYAAVTAEPGPALVLAGAGSGKTRTLTYRVAFLVEQGVRAENILLLTFTNKAAREMMGRVTELLGTELAGLWGGTFHSVGNRTLRAHSDLLGYPREFTILDREDANDLIEACLGEAGIDPKKSGFPKADVLGEVFSLRSSLRSGARDVLTGHFDRLGAPAEALEALRGRYGERKRQQGVVDFDDLLGLWLRLLEEHEDVREYYQRRFRYVLVDEYQDTNRLQSDLVDLLAARHGNLMAVGDDSQSIYSWRGANYENILRFPQKHPGTKIYKIETNYRSTPEILALANAAIAPNARQFAKALSPVRGPGMRPVVVVCADGRSQAQFVAGRVLELHEAGVGLDRMAVLYRSHFHSVELQLELRSARIPYSITSGIRFFEQAHVKDVAAYLKLVYNSKDETAFKRLVKMLPGIGVRAAEKLWQRFQARSSTGTRGEAGGGEPLGQLGGGGAELGGVCGGGGEVLGLAVDLQRLSAGVPKKAAVGWAQWTSTMAQIEGVETRDRPAAMIRLVVDAVYAEYVEGTYTNHRSRLEDLEQMADFAEGCTGTADFLTQLALLTDAEAEAAKGGEEAPRLRLSTVHQAKGLEFDVVFVPMLCEGMFPSHRSMSMPEGEEEERRLFYVAVTRARNELYLSYPIVRSTGGEWDTAVQEPSRFLRGLPPGVYDEWQWEAGGPF